MLGRYTREAQQSGSRHVIEILDKQCDGVDDFIRTSLQIIPPLSALFYSAFIFDIMGDKGGVVRATELSLLTILIPCVIWLLAEGWKGAVFLTHSKTKLGHTGGGRGGVMPVDGDVLLGI